MACVGVGAGSGAGPKIDPRRPSTRGTSCVPTRSGTMSSSKTFGPRTMRGVIEISTSDSSFLLMRAPNSFPMTGMLFIPSAPVKLEASLPCSRPPMSPVSPSRRRSVPVTLRVRNVGTLTGLSALPTLRSEPSRLNSAVSSIVMSPLAATRGVSVRFTPTFRYEKLVAGR